MKTIVVRGAVIRLISNGTYACLNLASTIILAHLLTPEQFGLFGMVFVIAEFARSFIELGLGTVTVQKNDLTHEEVNALFWINVATGIVFTLTLAILSPLVAWFYGDERLLNVCLLLSVVFLWYGLAIQHRSLLERQMHFGYMGAINVTATLVATVVAIAMALLGFGLWALVWRELVSASIYASGTWIFCKWRPARPRFDVDLRSSLRFGADLSAFGFLQYFGRSIDRILIGRFYGPTPLGLYTRAFNLAMMPIEHIRMTVLGVGLAPLSALCGNTERYRRFYSTLLSAMSFVYMPVTVFLAIESESIVVLLLGDPWLPAAPLLRVLAIGAFPNPLLSTFHLVLISSGRTRRYLHWGTINATCSIGAYLIGIQWAPIGVAYAYGTTNYCLLLWSLSFCLKGTPIDVRLVMRSIALPFIASVSAGFIRLALSPYPPTTGPVSSVLVSIVVITAAYLGTWICLPGGRRKLQEFVLASRELTIRHAA